MLNYVMDASASPERVAALRRSVGWGGMEAELGDPALHDYLRAACYDGERLVGFLAVVSNGATDAYIQDVIVLSGKGRRHGTDEPGHCPFEI